MVRLRVKHLKDVFFSKGVACVPGRFPRSWSATRSRMSFIPAVADCACRSSWRKGSYATIMVKRITDAADSSR